MRRSEKKKASKKPRQHEKHEPPKLPRFSCPKSMTSKVFSSKKDKAKSRRALNHLANQEEMMEDGN